MKHEELNEQLKELLLSSNRRFNKSLYGYYNKGIMTLLRYWGDADNIMEEYMREHDNKEEQERRELHDKENHEKAEKEKKDKEERFRSALKK